MRPPARRLAVPCDLAALRGRVGKALPACQPWESLDGSILPHPRRTYRIGIPEILLAVNDEAFRTNGLGPAGRKADIREPSQQHVLVEEAVTDVAVLTWHLVTR